MKNRSDLIQKVKEGAKLLPYLLPAIILSLSLASSLLVAAGVAKGPYSALAMPSGTVDPSETPPPDPNSGLTLVIHTADNAVLSASAGGKVEFEDGRANILGPVGTPTSVTATAGGTNFVVLNISDPQNDAFTPRLPCNGTTLDGSTVSIVWNPVSLVYEFHYSPLASFHGTEVITVNLVNSQGAPSSFKVTAISQ